MSTQINSKTFPRIGFLGVFISAMSPMGTIAQTLPACSANLTYKVFGENPSPVPSLSVWGGLLLASALGCLAARHMNRLGQKKVAIVAMSLAGIAGVGSGSYFVPQAMAAAASLADSTGGSAVITANNTTLTNNSGVVLTVSKITLGAGSLAASSTCKVGQKLAPLASCEVVLLGCSTPDPVEPPVNPTEPD